MIKGLFCNKQLGVVQLFKSLVISPIFFGKSVSLQLVLVDVPFIQLFNSEIVFVNCFGIIVCLQLVLVDVPFIQLFNVFAEFWIIVELAICLHELPTDVPDEQLFNIFDTLDDIDPGIIDPSGGPYISLGDNLKMFFLHLIKLILE